MQIKEFIGVCETSPEAVNFQSEKITEVDLMLKGFMEDGKYFSTGYIFSRHEKIFAAKGFGEQWGHEDKGVFRTDSIRRIASVTKMFTAVAIMQLVEQSKVYLAQQVSEIIEQFDNDMYGDITIQHLLTHTSGVVPDPGVFFEPYPLYRSVKNSEDWIKSSLEGRIANKPGSQWSYCSTGFCLLAEVISRTSGLPYDQYVMKNIVEPLGLGSTFFEIPESFMDKVCVDTLESLKWFQKKKDLTGKESVLGAGGLYSTLEDLHTFGVMLLNKGNYNGVRILSSRTVELMSKNQLGKEVITNCYGNIESVKEFGLGFVSDMQNSLSKGAFGHEGAGRCGICIDPVEELVVVYMQNMNEGITWDWEGVVGLRNVIWSGLL